MSACATIPGETGLVASGAIAFTDLVGFTAFCARYGDLAAVDLLDAHDRAVRDTLPFGARVIKQLGDGHLLWCPDPVACLVACLGVIACLAQRGPELPTLRAGLHWGRAARRGNDIVGHDVNLAARLVELAPGGEVLCSEAAWARIAASADGLWWEPAGVVTIRGTPDRVGVVRVAARLGAHPGEDGNR